VAETLVPIAATGKHGSATTGRNFRKVRETAALELPA
jgi:hypothetical protein